MKHIEVERHISPEEEIKIIKKAPVKGDADLIYRGKEDLHVTCEGETVCYLIRNAIPLGLSANYYTSVLKGGAIKKSDLRGDASGQEHVKVGKRSSAKESVDSSIIGYYDRYPRINYCRKTAWTQANDNKWTIAEEVTTLIDKLFQEKLPTEYKIHTEFSKRTSPDFLINGTAFTTITLNRNFRTHYHKDKGNLKCGLAAMSYHKTGKFGGGDLIFPSFRIGVHLKNHDVIIFKNTEVHGNTEIKTIGNSPYERLTSVFFYREKMIYCGTAEEELERAKKNKGDNIIGPVTEDLNKGRWP